ncbi:MAG: prepilin-type N-terminal cleavage/methylation domain-containing protein [bacterium]|nr:prepilin-type N-terminal cleavage/methylation domain-containing protein [bacterium]
MFANKEYTHSASIRKKKFGAFTLAEVLTTLTIIGVISVVVLPVLRGNINEKAIDSQKKTFTGKLNDGFHRMQIRSELAKTYDSTEDFVKTMNSYFSFAKTCSQNNLADCFGKKLKKGATVYDLTNINGTDDLGIRFSENAHVNGLVFNDGTTALIAYEPDCSIGNIFDTTINVTECIAMYYDVNGSHQGRSLVDEDVFGINTGEKAMDIGEVYSTTSKFDKSQCEDAKASGVPISHCPSNTDYYAYAKWFCHQKGKRLPTRAEFSRILSQVYGQPISSTGKSSNLQAVDPSSELHRKLSNNVFWTSEHERWDNDPENTLAWYWPYYVIIKDNQVEVARGWYGPSSEESVYGSIERDFLKFFCIE